MRSKFAPPAEKKYAESGEETHQPTHVVSYLKRDDKYVVRENKQQRAEDSFVLLLQLWYCNLESHLCQVGCEIKLALKI